MLIKEMIKWQRFCRILKRLNVINVNSEYCVKRVNFLFCLRFYSLQGRFVQELWLEIFRRQKISILTSKFDILRLYGFHDVYVFF